MSASEAADYRRMQVKVLYSFNNNATVFLSRSKAQHSVKIAQIPMYSNTDLEEEVITLGAFDLKQCAQQVLKNSPENFKLDTEDYAVYYKDITEQPDEPFVSNGVLSNLINSSKAHLVPGRVCQNLSASYLFGDKSNSSSLTLEIRLKLHTIERQDTNHQQQQQQQQSQTSAKRSHEPINYVQKRQRSKPMSSSSNAAVKATRTKSLPIFYHPPNQQIYNIMNADKSNVPSKYDSKSVQERFKLAPFLQAKIIDNPNARKLRNNNNNQHTPNNQHSSKENAPEPQRAMRTRSMVTSRIPLSISMPIQEDILSDATDDTEYNDNHPPIDEDEEEDEDEDEEDNEAFDENDTSPYTPQQPPYKANSLSNNYFSNNQFQALPDLEDLDSRKTHTIPHNKLPKNHGLVCTNNNCATTSSITWRYFETGFHPNYLGIHRATEFDKRHYEGMFGPLCNACYLFLRNKGFMRPEGVVKKYLQQQKYKKELKQKEAEDKINEMSNSYPTNFKARLNSLSNVAMRNNNQFASSPVVSQSHKFPTPLHTPSAINQVIQSNNNSIHNNNIHGNNRLTPNYNDLNDFMNQLNSFGGPLTDIDPMPQDQQQGITPPMMATKSNTRVINLYDDGEDKENCPPASSDDIQRSDSSSPNKNNYHDIDSMMVKSFNQNASTSPNGAQSEWINNLFGEPTPKDQTPKDGNFADSNGKVSYADDRSNEQKNLGGSKNDDTESEKEDVNQAHPHMPQLRTFTTNPKSSPNSARSKQSLAVNMPSSPLIVSQQDKNDEIGVFLASDSHHRSDNLSELDSEIHTFVGGDNSMFQGKENHSSPSIAKASRNNTTMSWGTNHKSAGLASIEGGSTPNTDFYSNDDNHSTQDKKFLHPVDINTVFNEQK